MKNLLLTLAFLSFLLATTGVGHGQLMYNIKPTDMGNAIIKEKLEKASKTALTKNPDLIKERQEILQDFNKLKSQGKNADPDDIKELLDRQRSYEKKWHEALIEVDPSLKSYFAEIEARKKRKK